MNLSFHLRELRHSAWMRWFLVGAWVLILAKCAVVAWAIERWNVPIHPAAIIVPTLLIAAVATALWLADDPAK